MHDIWHIIQMQKSHNVKQNNIERQYLVITVDHTDRIPMKTYRCFTYLDSAKLYVLTNYIEPLKQCTISGKKERKYNIEKEENKYQDTIKYTIRDPDKLGPVDWLLRIFIVPIEHYDDYDYDYEQAKTPFDDR